MSPMAGRRSGNVCVITPKSPYFHTYVGRSEGAAPEIRGKSGAPLRGLFARSAAGDVARDECRVHVLEDDLSADDDLLDVLAAWHLVHDRQQDFFKNRAQAASAGAAQDRLVGDGLQRVVGELQVDTVELEEAPVLPDQRVARLGQDPDEGLAVQVVHAR